jgi:dTDP-4-dehydrorhamnose 3,5-epimerase
MRLIKGNTHTDPRGTVRFVNDFHPDGIKRFYTITHTDTETFRAWQGHQRETKYFFAAKGSFRIHWIEIDNWEQPSKELTIHSHILTEAQSEILVIPPGHVNGFKALEPGSMLILFSNMSLEESREDDFRFPADYWALVTQCFTE